MQPENISKSKKVRMVIPPLELFFVPHMQSLNVANLSITNQALAVESQGSLSIALDIVNNATMIK